MKLLLAGTMRQMYKRKIVNTWYVTLLSAITDPSPPPRKKGNERKKGKGPATRSICYGARSCKRSSLDFLTVVAAERLNNKADYFLGGSSLPQYEH